MTKREIAVESLKNFLGLPYRWGGNDPLRGFDCSGLMIEILKTTGIIGAKEDYTAQQLANKYPETDVLREGVMVYWDWNNDGNIDHVEMIAFVEDSGELFTIGASGGGSATSTVEDAIEQDAYIKIRPLRSGYKMANDPFET